jgi:hypothetical protein
MATGSRRSARQPRDVRARERLREAQLQEANAVAAVFAAQQVLQRVCAKRDAAVAAANATVEQARESVSSAQGALVSVSGLNRAAVLLGVKTSELRAVSASRTARIEER